MCIITYRTLYMINDAQNDFECLMLFTIFQYANRRFLSFDELSPSAHNFIQPKAQYVSSRVESSYYE